MNAENFLQQSMNVFMQQPTLSQYFYTRGVLGTLFALGLISQEVQTATDNILMEKFFELMRELED